MLRSTILSHFDTVQGPSILATVPVLDRDVRPVFEAVPKLIDVADEEQFFVATLQGVYTANYFFKVDDASARGKRRLLLLSLAFEPSGLDDKDQALRFLNASESLLLATARDLKTNAAFFGPEIPDPANNIALMDRLHALHDDAFHGLLGSMIDPSEGPRGKIVVFGLPGVDAKGIVDTLMTSLKRDGSKDLRSRLIFNAASELVFMDFACIARGTPACWADRCPDCKGLAIESDAVLVVLEHGTVDAAAAQGIAPYLNAMTSAKAIPVVFMEVANQAGGEAGAAGPVELPGFDVPVTRFVVPRGDTGAFKDVMAWLVKRII